MIVPAVMSLVVLAQVFMTAALGPAPAYASVANFAILIYIAVFTRREIAILRREGVAAAAELARMAKGSEMRAEKAAAEIADSAAAMVVIGRTIIDEFRLMRSEWERLDEARRERDDTPPSPPTPPGRSP